MLFVFFDVMELTANSPHSLSDDAGGASGEDGHGLEILSREARAGTDSDVGGQGGAFGDYDMATQPDVVANSHGTVGIATVAIAVDQRVLVGVHNGAAPRGQPIGAEGDGLVADDE